MTLTFDIDGRSLDCLSERNEAPVRLSTGSVPSEVIFTMGARFSKAIGRLGLAVIDLADESASVARRSDVDASVRGERASTLTVFVNAGSFVADVERHQGVACSGEGRRVR